MGRFDGFGVGCDGGFAVGIVAGDLVSGGIHRAVEVFCTVLNINVK